MKRLFDHDPVTGIKKFWHVKGNGEYVVETVQDVKPVADQNKRQFNENTGRFGEFDKVASIPLSVYYELKRRGIADDPKAMKKWLNDRDNRVFRTKAGTL